MEQQIQILKCLLCDYETNKQQIIDILKTELF